MISKSSIMVARTAFFPGAFTLFWSVWLLVFTPFDQSDNYIVLVRMLNALASGVAPETLVGGFGLLASTIALVSPMFIGEPVAYIFQRLVQHMYMAGLGMLAAFWIFITFSFLHVFTLTALPTYLAITVVHYFYLIHHETICAARSEYVQWINYTNHLNNQREESYGRLES